MPGLGAGQGPLPQPALRSVAQSPFVSGVLTPGLRHSGFWLLKPVGFGQVPQSQGQERTPPTCLTSLRGQLLFRRLLSRVARVMLGHAPYRIHSLPTFKSDGAFVWFCFSSRFASPSGAAPLCGKLVKVFPTSLVLSGSNWLCRIYENPGSLWAEFESCLVAALIQGQFVSRVTLLTVLSCAC